MSEFDQVLPSLFTQEALHDLSLVLSAAVAKMLRVKGDIYLSPTPVIRERKIVQFGKRMRVDGLEKFGVRTILSSINFYRDKERMEQGRPIGVLVIYIPADYIARLMWLLEYGRIDEDNEGVILDACGTLTNLIAGYFVKELSGLGYIFLEMSHFDSYINTAVNGVTFSSEQDFKHEIEFYIRGEKKIVAELSMGKLPRY
ncbi:MAG: hypothetical protein HQL18_01155 [Candidatus Omnitrophica bacterium]|nr:hypothetical protein [Candidatus Omnitrophota bacterium]